MKNSRKYGNQDEGKHRPVCGYIPEDVPKSEGLLYGPPPIDWGIAHKPQPVVYGPPPAKSCTRTKILLAVGALLAGLIAWLVAGCLHVNQPTVYGPPPVDTTRTTSPVIYE